MSGITARKMGSTGLAELLGSNSARSARADKKEGYLHTPREEAVSFLRGFSAAATAQKPLVCRSAEQFKYLLRNGVCLRQHRGARLLEDLRARQVGGLGREVRINNPAACSRLILDRDLE